jgi:hypothetical protein
MVASSVPLAIAATAIAPRSSMPDRHRDAPTLAQLDQSPPRVAAAILSPTAARRRRSTFRTLTVDDQTD